MSVEIDPNGAAGSGGGLLNRRHAKARSDHWMQQMERALLAAPVVTHEADLQVAQAGPGGRRDRHGLADGAALAKKAAVAQPSPDGDAWSSVVARRDAGATARKRAPSQESAQGRDPGRSPHSLFGPEEDGERLDDPGIEPPVAAAFGLFTDTGRAAPTAPLSSSSANQLVQGAAGRPPAAGQAAPLAGAPLATLPAVAVATGAHASPTQSLQSKSLLGQFSPPRALPGFSAAAHMGMDSSNVEPAGTTTPAEADEPEASSGRRPATPGAREYGRRNLHVVLQDQGVALYIRDQQVQAHQLPALMHALNSQLATPGQTLLSVHLNGKPVVNRHARPFHDTVAALGVEHTEDDGEAERWPSPVNRSEE